MRKVVFQLSLSVLLLFFFAANVDWNEMGLAFSGLRLHFYIISALTALLGPIILAGKYNLLTSHTTLDIPFTRLMAINYIARFYALFLPTALGPEAVRWYKITKNKEGKSFFLASTIVERIFFLLLLFICGSVPLFFSREPAIQRLAAKLWPLLAVMGAGFVLVLVYFLYQPLHRAFKRFIVKKLRLANGSRLHEFLDNFSVQNASSKVLGILFLLTVVWQLSFLIRMYFIFVSLGLPFGFWDVTWMGSLVLLLQIIPVSFAGIGVREGAFSFLFSLHGIQSEPGVVVGILFFSQMLILCFVGWLCQLFERHLQ